MTARDLRDVIGQRIVAVRRSRLITNGQTTGSHEPHTIDLENGVRLMLTAFETETEPCGSFVINRTGKK